MRCIIAGSRSYHGFSVGIIARAVAASGFEADITEVVSGGAKGIDFLGEVWARGKGLPVKRFEPDYDTHGGKRAPLIRNVQMALYAAELTADSEEQISPDRGIGLLIAVHDSRSTGTAHMIKAARKLGLRVFVGHPKETHLMAVDADSSPQ